MSLPTLIEETGGWEVTDCVIVQTPTFATDPENDFGTFDWALTSDATLLTESVEERALSAGYEVGPTEPTLGGEEVTQAATWSTLQKFFTDVWFGDVVDPAYNSSSASIGNTTGFLSWSDIQLEDELSDDELFERFCLHIGLDDGQGNWGFRYADQEISGAPRVVYPNSTRTCQAGDFYSVPELLDDLLTALAAIKHVSWSSPQQERGGRKFVFNDGEAESGFGSSDSDYDPSSGWDGEASTEEAFAASDFAAGTGGFGLLEATAQTATTLSIDSATSQLLVEYDSDVNAASPAFTPDVDGPFVINIKATKGENDFFSALGSDVTDGWDTDSGNASAGSESQGAKIGVDQMNTDNFPDAVVASYTFEVTLSPQTSSGPEPYDWFAGASVKVDGSSIAGNVNLDIVWDGDLNEDPSDEYSGEALALSSGSYFSDFSAVLFAGSSNANDGDDSASADVSATTTSTTSTTTTTTTTTSIIFGP